MKIFDHRRRGLVILILKSSCDLANFVEDSLILLKRTDVLTNREMVAVQRMNTHVRQRTSNDTQNS